MVLGGNLLMVVGGGGTILGGIVDHVYTCECEMLLFFENIDLMHY
jgi:hypothetical protein